MAIAMSLEPEPYILECDKDKPEEEQTTFFLRNLSHQKWGAIMRQIGGKDGDAINLVGDSASVILLACLTGWKNYRQADGSEAPFEKNMDKNLNRIPGGWRMELALEVINRNQMTADDEKN